MLGIVAKAVEKPAYELLGGRVHWGGFHTELLERPIVWEDGYVIPPEGPGLGVGLDEDVVVRYPYEGEELHLSPAEGAAPWRETR